MNLGLPVRVAALPHEALTGYGYWAKGIWKSRPAPGKNILDSLPSLDFARRSEPLSRSFTKRGIDTFNSIRLVLLCELAANCFSLLARTVKLTDNQILGLLECLR